MGAPPDRAAAGTQATGGSLRRLLLIAVPLALLLGGIIFGYRSYVVSRERYLTESHIRALGTLAEQTEGTIEALATTFGNALDSAGGSRDKLEAQLALTSLRLASGRKMAKLDAYADATKRDHAEACPSSASACGCCMNTATGTASPPPGASTDPTPSPTDRAQSPLVRIRALPDLDRVRQTRDWTHRNQVRVVRMPRHPTAETTLLFCSEGPAGARDRSGGDARCAERSLSEIVLPVYYGSTVSHLDLFIVDGAGRVLLEHGNSGLRLAQLPLLARDGGDSKDAKAPTPTPGLPSVAEVQQSTVIRTVQIEGAGYRLISQPLRIQAGTGYDTWAIGILMPTDGLERDGQRLPLMIVLGVPLLLLLALLVLPFVKLATIGAREPLTAGTVVGLVGGLLLGTALVCIAALDWFSYRTLRTQLDVELRALASAMQTNLEEELSQAVSVLARFVEERGVQRVPTMAYCALERPLITCTELFTDPQCSPSSAAAPRPPGPPAVRLAGSPLLLPASTRSGALHDRFVRPRSSNESLPPARDSAIWLRGAFSRYPWFTIIGLARSDGMQIEKWAVAKRTTPWINMSAYSGFIDVRDRRLLRVREHVEDASPLHLREHSVAMNVMTSPNTSETLNVLTMPVGPAPDDDVAFMVADLRSVSQPLLPPDVGFAILDPNGRAVFHSNSRARLYETFFAEISDPLPLRSAVFSGQTRWLDFEYQGEPHRALVQPLRYRNWSLVVFGDRDLLTMANAESAFIAIVMMTALVGVYLLWALGARLLLGAGALAVLQPNPRATARYGLLLPPLALLGVWVAAVVRGADPLWGELAAITGALAALSATLLVLAPGHGIRTRRWAAGIAVLALLCAAAVALSLKSLLLAAEWISPKSDEWLLLVPLLGAAVGMSVVLAGWEPGWRPAGPIADRALARAYTAVALLLVVLLAVLPATALFRDAFDNEIRAMVSVRQLRLAADQIIRQREFAHVQEQRNGLQVPSPAATKDACRWTFVGRTAFSTGGGGPSASDPCDASASWEPATRGSEACVAAADGQPHRWFMKLCTDEPMQAPACPDRAPFDPARERCRDVRGGLSALLFAALPTFTQEGVWMRHAAAEAAADCSWARAADGRLCVLPKWSRSQEISVPAWRVAPALPTNDWARAAIAIAVLLALVALWGLLRWVVRVVGNLDLWEVAAAGDAVEVGRGEYWIRPSAEVRGAVRARAAHWIDCDAIATPAALGAVLTGVSGRVALVHFERDLDDPAWNAAKLALLEALLLGRGAAVDVLSDVDVLAHFAQRLQSPSDEATTRTYVSDAEMARWARVLAVLDKRHADLPPPPLPPRTGAAALLLAECRWTPRLRGIRAAILADPRWTALSEERLLEHIGDLADAHYRVLWSRLTDEERLVLYHLASTGLLNPRSQRFARPLLRSGLIRRTPLLRLMNESFRRFVRTAETRTTIRDWQRAGDNLWVWVRNGVVGLVILAAVVLFLTQPESYAKWAALLGALTTVGGGVTSLLGLFQARRGENG